MGRNPDSDRSENVDDASLACQLGDTIGYGGIFVVSAYMCLAGLIATTLIRGSDVGSTRARGGEVVEPARATPTSQTTHVAGIRQLLADRRMMAFAVSVVL